MKNALVPEHIIRVGPAGWSYPDWEGTVYPPHTSRFDHLTYLSTFFDTIEVNSSFYRIPPPSHATSWLRRVGDNPSFRFTAKSFRGFTHDASHTEADVAASRHFLDPLQENDRLGALLHQFPWSFKASRASMTTLERLLLAFRDYPQVVEVRHSSFATEEFLSLLASHGAGFVNIDQPLFSDSISPSTVVAGRVAYVRFHGRNYQKWFNHEESWERYDYLYSAKELSPWVERVREMSTQKETYVITNNHFRGQAIVNAVELKQELGLETRIPPQLLSAYPDRMRNAGTR